MSAGPAGWAGAARRWRTPDHHRSGWNAGWEALLRRWAARIAPHRTSPTRDSPRRPRPSSTAPNPRPLGLDGRGHASPSATAAGCFPTEGDLGDLPPGTGLDRVRSCRPIYFAPSAAARWRPRRSRSSRPRSGNTDRPPAEPPATAPAARPGGAGAGPVRAASEGPARAARLLPRHRSVGVSCSPPGWETSRRRSRSSRARLPRAAQDPGRLEDGRPGSGVTSAPAPWPSPPFPLTPARTGSASRTVRWGVGPTLELEMVSAPRTSQSGVNEAREERLIQVAGGMQQRATQHRPGPLPQPAEEEGGEEHRQPVGAGRWSGVPGRRAPR